MVDFSNLPAPSSYQDWQSWASMLVQQLQNAGQENVVSLPVYMYDSSKARNGLPPAAKGDLVWLLQGGKRKLAVWDGNTWITYAQEP